MSNGRRKSAIALTFVLASMLCHPSFSVAQGETRNARKVEVSKEPLSKDEVAIYRVVLAFYLRNYEGTLNVSRKLNPLSAGDPGIDKECSKEFILRDPKDHAFEPHDLGSAFAESKKIKIIDPDVQRVEVEKNDPSKKIYTAVEDGGKPGEDQIAAYVKKAFENGIFSLSEIAFDKNHNRAVVAYSFNCGMLCGHGDTLILVRTASRWKISKRCGGWIS